MMESSDWPNSPIDVGSIQTTHSKKAMGVEVVEQKKDAFSARLVHTPHRILPQIRGKM